MKPGVNYRPFESLEELVEWLKTHETVYYQAPLDAYPHPARVKRYTINNADIKRSTAVLWAIATLTFEVKLVEHFERFRTEGRPAAETTALETRYRALAKECWHEEGEIEIDDNATVSCADEKQGAYVQGWLWVDAPGGEA